MIDAIDDITQEEENNLGITEESDKKPFPDEFPEFNLPDELPAQESMLTPDAEAIKWMMSPEEELDRLELALAGYYLDRKRNKWVRLPKDKRLMKDYAVFLLMSAIRANVAKNVSQGKYTVDHHAFTMLEFNEGIGINIACNAEKYGIHFSHLTQIQNMIDHHVDGFTRRAIDAQESGRFGNQPPPPKIERSLFDWQKYKLK